MQTDYARYSDHSIMPKLCHHTSNITSIPDPTPVGKKKYMFVVLHWFERNGLRNFTSTSKKIGKRLELETEKLWPIVKG